MSLSRATLPPRLPSSILDLGDNSDLSELGQHAENFSLPALNEKASSLEFGQEKASSSKSASDTEVIDKTRSDDIIYQYLDFNTELPIPFSESTHASPLGPEPQPPSLERYGSPFEWTNTRKSLIVWISTVSTCLTAYTAGSYVYGVDQMSQEWHVSSVASLVGVTVFTAGFAGGPMFTAPFSELNGRRPVFVVTGILFVIFQACCAITRTYYGMLISRFCTGVSASTFSTMVGGVISDIYHSRQRNTPMAIYTGGVFFGTGFGPLVSGFIAQNLNWRWIFYVQIISCGIVMAIIVCFFPETRGDVLLSKKAKILNDWYDTREQAGYYDFIMPNQNGQRSSQRIRWKVKADEDRGSLREMLTISLYRPFHLLFTEPVVFFFSLWISFSWAILYLTFSAVPLLFEDTYGFSLEQTGAVFSSLCIVAIFFTAVGIYQDRLALHYGKMSLEPEGRLYFPCVESILLPLGLFWLGWTIFPSIPWIVPVLGLAAATMGIMSVYLCVFNYFADTYHRYASSAIAAQSFCRNMLGGAFPLFTDQMFRAMGFHATLSFLGGVGLALTLVPWVLLFYGVKIRLHSKFASEIMK